VSSDQGGELFFPEYEGVFADSDFTELCYGFMALRRS